jgi:molecular chaperone DnaJ
MMQTQTVCPSCSGEGKVIKHKCKKCNGEGVTYGEEIIDINIPAGITGDMIYTIRGKGNAGRRNGIAGDIQVVVDEVPHDKFVRSEKDVIYNLLLSFPQAALGCTIDVPTITGKARINIEPGTQPGKVLRLKGKGIPAIKEYDRQCGDEVIKISVYIPEKLSQDEKEKIKNLEDCDNLRPSESITKQIFNKFKTFFD